MDSLRKLTVFQQHLFGVHQNLGWCSANHTDKNWIQALSWLDQDIPAP